MQIQFVDQTLRDGQQSLWGLKMQPFEASAALPHLRDTGFRTIDLTGAGMFTVLTRDIAVDAWAALDFLVAGLRPNEVRSGMRTNAVIGFQLAPHAIIDLWIKTLIKHGSTSFWLYDCAFDLDVMKRVVDVVADNGGEPVPAVMYGLTSVHDDDFFATRAATMAEWSGVRSIYVEDAPGVLTPERARTLLPAIRQRVRADMPIELHFHNTTGLAPLNYMIGIEAGYDIIHTASRPMANNYSLPSTERMVDIVEYLGHSHGLDVAQFAPVAENFERSARRGGHLLGVPAEYDPRIYDHQLPGGATGTLIKQLTRHGMQDRLPEVLREIPQVRRDLGEPIMATPFSQFVGIQAVLNIITGERYSLVPDETIHYLLGRYGPIYGPVDEEVRDRILDSPRARALESWEQPQPSLKEIRGRFPSGISDEELLLRFMIGKEEVDRALAAGPLRTDPRTSANEIVNNVVDLISERRRVTTVSIRTDDFSLDLAKKEV